MKLSQQIDETGLFSYALWEGVSNLESEITRLTKQLEKAERDAAISRDLRELCGYVEDGSSEVVLFFQDDATRDWCIKVGSGKNQKCYYAPSFRAALDKAMMKGGAA